MWFSSLAWFKVQQLRFQFQRENFFQDSALIKFAKVREVTIDSLYLRATIDPNIHLALDAQINSLKALTLVDSEDTGVFMHSTFAKQCKVVVRLKVMP